MVTEPFWQLGYNLGWQNAGRVALRVIIRHSIDGEPNSHLRNKLVGRLQKAGFSQMPNTASWTNDNIDEGDLATFLADYWRCAYRHHHVSGYPRARRPLLALQ